MPQLICEGACNPGLAGLDRELKGREKRTGTGTRFGPPLVLQHEMLKLRDAAYTLHTHIAGSVYECGVCHSQRRF
jgi:hypothetical protein